MQVLVLFALIAASQAAVLLGGASEQYRSQDGLGNYAFGYNEGHGTGASFRRESGSNGVVAGSYGLTVADGRQRIVNYVADAAGFRADIKTNEPGVEPKDPAHTAINKAAVAITAPAVAYAAPAHYAAPLAPAAALQYAAGVPHAGAFAYNTAIGHHGLAHHGLAHHGYYW
ncbi:cuticle protein 14-like [Argiope bruennichi]|uniref:Cuticle protein 14 isoform b like protein n=1 Tax=Argiope bruennichi TaxID=94029 RepID=A0A8T0EVF9_ARGBR|nr:cuticle protein 14-like [Argiope bruennichi]KAF8782303.1 Cuticle protein 14 isoform b like protein [Argiope bruennichi]